MAQQGGPGPASGISYTIKWNDPSLGPVERENQVPDGPWRWPDTIDTDSEHMVRKWVQGIVTPEGEVLWNFTEPPMFGCDGATGLGAFGDERSGGFEPEEPPPPGPPSGPASTPAGGGSQ